MNKGMERFTMLLDRTSDGYLASTINVELAHMYNRLLELLV